MLKIFAYTCLLFALSVVEMKPLNINGQVGGSVTFKCSDWNVWTHETSYVKYLCYDPCSEDKHIIVKAAFGETTRKNRIQLMNRADGLFVTFTNLQKFDSKVYYCGLERSVKDSYIKVYLKVTDAVSSRPKTTPKTAVDGSNLSSLVTNSPSVSSHSSDVITDMSTTLYSTTPSASATQGAGYLPYLIAGLILITTAAIGLILTRTMMKKRQMAVSIPQEDTRETAAPDDVYQSLNTLTMDKDQVYSTLTPMERV